MINVDVVRFFIYIRYAYTKMLIKKQKRREKEEAVIIIIHQRVMIGADGSTKWPCGFFFGFYWR